MKILIEYNGDYVSEVDPYTDEQDWNLTLLEPGEEPKRRTVSAYGKELNDAVKYIENNDPPNDTVYWHSILLAFAKVREKVSFNIDNIECLYCGFEDTVAWLLVDAGIIDTPADPPYMVVDVTQTYFAWLTWMGDKIVHTSTEYNDFVWIKEDLT